MKHFIVGVALIGSALVASHTQAQNIVQNGKFTQQTEGWGIASSHAATIEHSADFKAYGLADNFAGIHFVELDASSAIQQTVSTKKGEKYVLDFAFSHRPAAGDKQLIVLVNGSPVFTEKVMNNQEAGNFRHKYFIFTAEKEQTTVSFYVASLGGDDTKGVLLTDVILGEEKELNINLQYSY